LSLVIRGYETALSLDFFWLMDDNGGPIMERIRESTENGRELMGRLPGNIPRNAQCN